MRLQREDVGGTATNVQRQESNQDLIAHCEAHVWSCSANILNIRYDLRNPNESGEQDYKFVIEENLLKVDDHYEGANI
jgi:hypothetical protein